MKSTATKRVAPSVDSTTDPISIRFTRDQRDWLERQSSELHYSVGKLVGMLVDGGRAMIETPDGQPMKEPEVVALARFIKKPVVGNVAGRKG